MNLPLVGINFEIQETLTSSINVFTSFLICPYAFQPQNTPQDLHDMHIIYGLYKYYVPKVELSGLKGLPILINVHLI